MKIALVDIEASGDSETLYFLVTCAGDFSPTLKPIPQRWRANYKVEIEKAMDAQFCDGPVSGNEIERQSRWAYFVLDQNATDQCPEGYVVLTDGVSFIVLRGKTVVGYYLSLPDAVDAAWEDNGARSQFGP
ncbi:hypothetical protein [Rhodopseudomonas palustris]|uniref:hypothetical protein n=1 Tax=Rhodopseudomonas palustris TaxID=1076 RepID=UPI001058BD94|nr:hypothetical protein [Rhodopseudomonas palustris]QLH71676.1 hypothetical protein HZF03_13110 [Rhodopseudomonas palustris]